MKKMLSLLALALLVTLPGCGCCEKKNEIRAKTTKTAKNKKRVRRTKNANTMIDAKGKAKGKKKGLAKTPKGNTYGRKAMIDVE